MTDKFRVLAAPFVGQVCNRRARKRDLAYIFRRTVHRHATISAIFVPFPPPSACPGRKTFRFQPSPPPSSKFRAKSASIDYGYSARCRTGVSRRKSAAIEPRLEISLACAALRFTYAGQPQYHDVTTGPSIACTHSSKRRLERSSGGDGQ